MITTINSGFFKSLDYYKKVIIALFVLGLFVVPCVSLANSGYPVNALSATYNTSTGILNISGSYAGVETGSNERAGVAFFINGSNPVNPGSGSLDGVNTHTIHIFPTPATATGNFSDLHTLSSAPSSICAVIYDVSQSKIGSIGSHSDVPAGSLRNTDNSYENASNSYGSSASACATPTIITPPQPPTVDIKANNSNGPISINYNTSATISWTSNNATSCQVTPGNWTGLSGSQSTGNLTTSQTYTITCSNSSGNANDSVVVNVQSQPLPTVSLVVNPSQIIQGDSAILSWTSSNANSCTASGGWSGTKAVSGTQSVTPNSTTQYTITCSNSAGQAVDQVTVTVTIPQTQLPTVNIIANPDQVNQGYSSILSWSSTNANTCVASGAWSGSQSLSGTHVVTPNATSTYTITCSNGSGSAVDSSTVKVILPAAQSLPIVSIIANPITINYGGSSILTWQSSNAATCVASNGWSGSKNLNGIQTVSPTATTTYIITCSNSSGSAQDSVVVNVQPQSSQQQPPTVSLIANPLQINQGDSSILSWNSTNADTCVASTGWSGSKALSGNTTVFPSQTTVYTLTCSNTIGQATQSVTVTVQSQQLQLPTVTLIANPQQIIQGNSSILTWSSNNATACSASGGWSGTQATSGSQVVTPNQTTTYGMTCSNNTGQASQNTVVTVTTQQQQLPTVSISANPSTINQGNSSLLSWTSYNASFCTAFGGWSGSKSLSGSEYVTPNQNTTYGITCTNTTGQQASQTTTVLIQNQQQQTLPTVSLSVNPSQINQGNSSTLYWSSTNANYCSASGAWSGNKSISGSEVVTPGQTNSYTITCSNSYGSASDNKSVFVLASLPPPTLSAFSILKTVRNISLNQDLFTNGAEGQGLDTLEFEIRVRNIGSVSVPAIVNDSLPSELFYISGSTNVNGVSVADGITSGGLSLGTLQPGEERVIPFQAIIFLGGTQKGFIRPRTSNGTTGSSAQIQSGAATVQVRNRGRVLGASTIVTGPENLLPWVLFSGFVASFIAYILLFKYRLQRKYRFTGSVEMQYANHGAAKPEYRVGVNEIKSFDDKKPRILF